MRFKSSKYLKRLIIFSLLLGTLPVIAQGVFFFRKSSDMVQRKVNDLNMQILSQTQMRVEEVLNNIHSYYMVLGNSYAGQYADTYLDFKQYDKIIDIRENLMDFQHLSSWVRSAYLVNFEKDWIIGNDGFGFFSDMANKNKFLDLLGEPRYCLWTFNETPSDTSIHMNISREFPIDSIFLLIKLPLNSCNPSEAIVVNLSASAISQMLSKTSDTGKTLILDENSKVLAASDPGMIGMDISRLPYMVQLNKQATTSGFFESNVDGSKVGVTFRKSQYNGWTYLTIYSVSEITKDSRSIGLASVVICVAMIGLAICVSVLGSTIMYNPVKNVYEIIRKSVNTGAGKYDDEFKYIGEGISTLVNSRSIMQKQIKTQLLQLEEFLLLQLVDGELRSDEVEAKLKNLGRECLWKSMCIVTMQINSPEGLDHEINNSDLIMVAIRDITKKLIPEDFRLQPILKKPGLVTLIGNNQEDKQQFKEFVYSFADRISQKVKSELGIGISIGISYPFETFDKAYIAYRESMEALICKVRNEDQSILFYEMVHPERSIADPYPQHLENELIDAINIGRLDKAENVLDQIINEIFSKDRSINDIQVCLLRLMIGVIRILQDSGERIDSLFQEIGIIYEELYTLKTSSEIKEWFNGHIIQPVAEALEYHRSRQNKAILEKVMQIIHEEYDTDLTIESCAQRLNYHPSHIWRVLRKEMDTTFSDYLAQYRLKKAKEWLRDTNMTIAEIAEKLRYTNSQNFIRFFKKMEGATPGQYRDTYRSFK